MEMRGFLAALSGCELDQLHIKDKNPALNHHRTGKPAADRPPPLDFQSPFGK
jgi:hypothetical protein